MKTVTLGFHHFGMQTFALLVFALLSILDLADLQAAKPGLRPALIGNGPNALINIIDTKKLMEKGQRDGLLMFQCNVDRFGKVPYHLTYGETPGSALLEKEVEKAIWHYRFIRAIYNGERTEVVAIGTILFFVTDGKPHLRIYMNQNRDDIANGNDFIAPQLLPNTPDWHVGDYDPVLTKAGVYRQQGAVVMSITVDANGNQKDLKVILEKPAGFGFAEDMRKTYAKTKWIPGFRNGHPVNSTIERTRFYIP